MAQDLAPKVTSAGLLCRGARRDRPADVRDRGTSRRKVAPTPRCPPTTSRLPWPSPLPDGFPSPFGGGGGGARASNLELLASSLELLVSRRHHLPAARALGRADPSAALRASSALRRPHPAPP